MRPLVNGVAITHRKNSASPHGIRSAYASTVIGSRTGPRRALGIAAQPAKRGYRPDLRTVSVCLTFSFIRDSPRCKIPAFSLEPTGDAFERHEGWAWTCLQDKSLLRWSRSNSSELSSYAIGARSMLGASCRRIGDDIASYPPPSLPPVSCPQTIVS